MSEKKSLSLSFEGVGFEVEERRRGMVSPLFWEKRSKKVILEGITGIVKGGQCCAILGGSGSGKTSLLDAICAHTTQGISGKFCLNGHEAGASARRQRMAYVMQDDSHLSLLTVRETLMYAAQLRLPRGTTNKEREERVGQVISDLALLKVADTKIGGIFLRGISGGEKRRVTVAIQLLSDPDFILLDEPTTGLDASTASNLVDALMSLAQKNKVVLFTIHQPRSDIFPKLDLVMLLSNGKTCYFGPANQIIRHFSATGYRCGELSNPLDYYLDVITLDKRSAVRQERRLKRLERLTKHFEESPLFESVIKQIEEAKGTQLPLSESLPGKERPNGLFILSVLVRRLYLIFQRSFEASFIRFNQPLAVALIMWLLYFHFDHSQQSVTDRSGIIYTCSLAPSILGLLNAVTLFPDLRNLYYREAADKLYSSFIFTTSLFLHLVPINFLVAQLFSLIVYFAIGFSSTATQFFIFSTSIWFEITIGELVGTLLLSVMWDFHSVTSVGSVFVVTCCLFGSAFVRAVETTPEAIRYLGYASFVKYPIEIMMANEYFTLDLECDEGERCLYETGNDYLQIFFPNAENHYVRNFLVTLLFLFFFASCAAVTFHFYVPKLR